MKHKRGKIVKIVFIILGVVLLLFFALVLFIRSPWGQHKIVNYATNYVSEKTNTKVEIDQLFITFDGNLLVKDLFLEDIKGDTLIYSKYLEANVPLWSMIRGGGYGVDALKWEGLRAYIHRKDTINGYNFQFLLDAFASADSTMSVEKDSTASPLTIIIGDLHFKDIDLIFEDAVLGIDTHLVIGELDAVMKEFDVNSMTFKLDKGAVSNAKISYKQKPVVKKAKTEPSILPFLVIDQLDLRKVHIVYTDLEKGINTLLDINHFYAEIPKLDLAKNSYKIEALELENSLCKLSLEKEEKRQVIDSVTTENTVFSWPEIDIDVSGIDFKNNRIQYDLGKLQTKRDSLNFNHLYISEFNLEAETFSLREETLKINLEKFELNEKSGIHLNQFAFDAQITDQSLLVENVLFHVNNTKINGKLSANFTKLANFLQEPEKSKFDLNLSHYQFEINDLFYLQPKLKENVYIQTLSEKLVSGDLAMLGSLSSFQLKKANLSWGDSTKISMQVGIQHVTNIEKLQFSIPNFIAKTNQKDVSLFLSEKDLEINLPTDISLSGNAQGTLHNVSAKAKLNTSLGIITLDGSFKNQKEIIYDAAIELKEIKLGKILNNNKLDSFNAAITSSGNGANLNELNAKIDAQISSFTYNTYTFKGLHILGNLENGTGNINSTYKDENLNMTLDATVVLDSVASEIGLDLHVAGANLQALGIIKRDLRTGFNLTADFKGNSTSFDFTSKVNDNVIVYDNKTYIVGDIIANAFVRPDTTSVFVKNRLFDVNLESNTDPQTFSQEVKSHVMSYFYRDSSTLDKSKIPVNLRMNAKIKQDPLLNDIFFLKIKDADTIILALDFKEKTRALKAQLSVPNIMYAGNEIDSLALAIETNKEEFTFNLGFKEINAGPLAIPKTVFKGNQENDKMNLKFTSYFDDEIYNSVQAEITGKQDSLRLHIFPDLLKLNKLDWETPQDNTILYTKTKINFNNFKFSHEDQTFEITDRLPTIEKEHLALDFQNFKLNTLFSYLNAESNLVNGELNGHFIIENPLENSGFLANLSLDNLSFLDVDLGRLTAKGGSKGDDRYDFNLDLSGGAIDLKVTGDYTASEQNPDLSLIADLKSIKMEALEAFSQGEIINASGNITGKLNVNGTIENPVYEGKINFNNANFKIKKLNSAFTLANETIEINKSNFAVNNFTVQDINASTLTINGKVGTMNFLNPTFDLKMATQNFQLLNAKMEDNDFLYGLANFDATMNLTGDLNIPILKLKFKVNKATNLTYFLPNSAVNIESREGVVVFVNKENPDAILSRTEEKSANLTGYDIQALITTDKEALFTVIIDKQTGDNFQFSGEADLNFAIDPNGRMSLSGFYNANKGHYEMNLYNLVNRKFELAPDSRVTWSGSPYDANLDIRTIYNVKTSAYSLMAAQTSGLDPTTKNKYQQALPFYVYLNIGGELMQPKISFQLDMPEEEQGAIGGQVYGRVQEVNQREDELNRQVFSLLVLNRFYPESGSDGSSGGVSAIARSNLNSLLSDQLNVFSDKLMGDTGVKLDFGLNSFTDYQGTSEEQRTQLDINAQKKLFNDRLIVKVGSEVDIEGSGTRGAETSMLGNASLEYLLSESGKYRLKAFQKSEFETVIDGQTKVSGIALIFTREFNKFRELWDAMFYAEKKKQKQIEAKEAREEEVQEIENKPN